MPIEDLEAKIKAVMAKSKTALAAQPAPPREEAFPSPRRLMAAARRLSEPAALLDAVFGGDGDGRGGAAARAGRRARAEPAAL